MSKQNETISDKLTRLSELVAWFEGHDFSLEVALDKFSDAEKLAKEIDTELVEFKNKITILKKDFSQP